MPSYAFNVRIHLSAGEIDVRRRFQKIVTGVTGDLRIFDVYQIVRLAVIDNCHFVRVIPGKRRFIVNAVNLCLHSTVRNMLVPGNEEKRYCQYEKDCKQNTRYNTQFDEFLLIADIVIVRFRNAQCLRAFFFDVVFAVVFAGLFAGAFTVFPESSPSDSSEVDSAPPFLFLSFLSPIRLSRMPEK